MDGRQRAVRQHEDATMSLAERFASAQSRAQQALTELTGLYIEASARAATSELAEMESREQRERLRVFLAKRHNDIAAALVLVANRP
jgi:hypothetical protein